ncbi:hypothetical protein ACFQ3P_41145 [Paraburkholderia sabiae]|uniref:hypothetical protein n=1 Tax=Paraburkholderia sabiae TaxID=273251 RepID=UPI00319E8372
MIIPLRERNVFPVRLFLFDVCVAAPSAGVASVVLPQFQTRAAPRLSSDVRDFA